MYFDVYMHTAHWFQEKHHLVFLEMRQSRSSVMIDMMDTTTGRVQLIKHSLFQDLGKNLGHSSLINVKYYNGHLSGSQNLHYGLSGGLINTNKKFSSI